MNIPTYDIEALPEHIPHYCNESWANGEYTLRDKQSR